ncbi:MAG: hypothetical protein K0S56_1317, partial [Microvirga sp.]|nr:hypothetical protein [Microvirga sp.]
MTFRDGSLWDLDMNDTRGLGGGVPPTKGLNAGHETLIDADVPSLMADLGRRARKAARRLGLATT